MERDFVSSVSNWHLGHGSACIRQLLRQLTSGIPFWPSTHPTHSTQQMVEINLPDFSHTWLLSSWCAPRRSRSDVQNKDNVHKSILQINRCKMEFTLHRRQEYCPCLLQLWHFKFSCSTTWQDAWCSNWSSWNIVYRWRGTSEGSTSQSGLKQKLQVKHLPPWSHTPLSHSMQSASRSTQAQACWAKHFRLRLSRVRWNTQLSSSTCDRPMPHRNRIWLPPLPFQLHSCLHIASSAWWSTTMDVPVLRYLHVLHSSHPEPCTSAFHIQHTLEVSAPIKSLIGRWDFGQPLLSPLLSDLFLSHLFLSVLTYFSPFSLSFHSPLSIYFLGTLSHQRIRNSHSDRSSKKPCSSAFFRTYHTP